MLKEEFKEFQDYAKTMMLQNPTIYKNLGPGVSKYVNEAWQVIYNFLKLKLSH